MAFISSVGRSVALGLALLLCATLTQAQSFPCPSLDSNSKNVAGGYANLNQNDLSTSQVVDLGFAVNSSFTQWVEKDGNGTLCDDLYEVVSVEFGLLQVCSQVVAGTNYGIKFLASYNCLIDDETALAQDSLVLNAVVYQPLPRNGVEAEPQVKSVARDTSVPIEQGELPVQFIALAPLSAPAAPGSPDDDNILAAGPTGSQSSQSASSLPFTLEGL